MSIKCVTANGPTFLLLMAFQLMLLHAQGHELPGASPVNNLNKRGTSDTNLNLREAILRVKEYYHVDILFDDAVVSGMFVSSEAPWSKSINAEDALTKLLTDFQLSFKKVKKDTYIIVITTSKKGKKQFPETPDTGGNANGNITGSASAIRMQNTLVKNSPSVVITGTVFDQSGKELSGVSVGVKGTQKGTITNITGRFTINVEDERPADYAPVQ